MNVRRIRAYSGAKLVVYKYLCVLKAARRISIGNIEKIDLLNGPF